MFVSKKLFSKLLYFLGLKSKGEDIIYDLDVPENLFISRGAFDYEIDKVWKDLKRQKEIMLELTNHIEAIVKYLDIKIEDYPVIEHPLFEEKKAVIKQRYVKNK